MVRIPPKAAKLLREAKRQTRLSYAVIIEMALSGAFESRRSGGK